MSLGKRIQISTHGSIGWSCGGGTVLLSELSSERRIEPATWGNRKGKTAVYGRCPYCEKKGRTFWTILEIKEN